MWYVGYYKASMHTFVSLCIYRLSAKLKTKHDEITARIKDFACDCCQGITDFICAVGQICGMIMIIKKWMR